MCKRIIMPLVALFVSVSTLRAYTPVWNVILKYEDVKGARDFVLKGAGMAMARGFLKRYPVAPLADDVLELAVLKMGNASVQSRNAFLKDLDAALRSYEYYGKYDSENGTVDIYVLRSGPETVSELVIYNPAIFSLNSLLGNFQVSALLRLDHPAHQTP